jgi:hypothetical protein
VKRAQIGGKRIPRADLCSCQPIKKTRTEIPGGIKEVSCAVILGVDELKRRQEPGEGTLSVEECSWSGSRSRSRGKKKKLTCRSRRRALVFENGVVFVVVSSEESVEQGQKQQGNSGETV